MVNTVVLLGLLKLVFKEKRELKNLKVAKEKVEIFWETVTDILKEDEKLTFKGWGSFKTKKIK